jgi:hypothetical protein
VERTLLSVRPAHPKPAARRVGGIIGPYEAISQNACPEIGVATVILARRTIAFLQMTFPRCIGTDIMWCMVRKVHIAAMAGILAGLLTPGASSAQTFDLDSTKGLQPM